jgi:hypothetical protein
MSSHYPPNPNHIGKAKEHQDAKSLAQNKEWEEETAPQEFSNTNFLLFPTHTRKLTVDEQFAHFVEMIQKIHVSIPLMDVLHVPSYAWYIKDTINNKRPLPTTEVIKLTEECSATILNRLLEKKDPGCPTITCSIGTQQFDHALCNLGASVSVMPKVVFDQLNFTHLSPMLMQL